MKKLPMFIASVGLVASLPQAAHAMECCADGACECCKSEEADEAPAPENHEHH